MSASIRTVADLVERWKEEKLLGAEGPEAIVSALGRPRDETPWFVKAFVAASAWFAALLGLVFIGLFLVLIGFGRAEGAFIVVGIAVVAAAVKLHSAKGKSLFFGQVAVAFSLAGQGATTLGALQIMDLDGFTAVLCLGAFTVVLYRLLDDAIHRFVGVAGTLAVLAAVLMETRMPFGLQVLIGATAWAGGWLFTRFEKLHAYRPVAYATLLAAPACTWALLVVRRGGDTPVWAATPALALGLVALYAWAAEGADRERTALIPVVLATALLSVLSTPGVLLSLAFLVLGHGRRDRALTVFGALFLPLFLIHFYFEMKTSLLAKSGSLFATGLVLLGLRALLRARSRREEAAR